MKHILVSEYFATGEGVTLDILFTNSTLSTEEQILEEFKAKLDPYFHVGIEALPLDEISEVWISRIKAHVPSLYSFLMGPRDYLIGISYHGHMNFS
jgi:hypothetical protein